MNPPPYIVFNNGHWTVHYILPGNEMYGKEFKRNPNREQLLVNVDMAFIKGGNFMMGNKDTEDEKPRHEVMLNDFYIGKYEVTQSQWKTVMGNNPSKFKGDNLPVECVSWNEVQEFIQKLNTNTGKKYRLPTEAEWEYSCRAGTTTSYNTGDNITSSQANYNEKNEDVYGRKTSPVGSFPPNKWGLYDMHGNVPEWCSDWYEAGYRTTSPITDPKGPTLGKYKILRGGSFKDGGMGIRSTSRSYETADNNLALFGFRVAYTK